MTVSEHWEQIAAEKRAARDALIPKEWNIGGSIASEVVDVMDVPARCGILSPAELDITETDATTLVKLMVNNSLTSEAVTTAFCKRAAIAQQLVGDMCGHH